MAETSPGPATRSRVIRCALYTRPSAQPASDESVNAQAARIAAYAASIGLDVIPIYQPGETPADGEAPEPESL